ncbi:hypothetical protein, variant 13 [Aphanomyces invadans]|uniref:Uncharacterized protein n=1 Tax=Aphanomyces invadans TaxID=157072 RepID=A0A024TD18_9STRA|nr:hypothetical protein H310_14004 [Aphanomyces invadans]XP_008879920.1 hypothetical protein, variant 7 [Aphanomyces invadans]XP_008879921.1 hypothetical protein, variant 1 [Aphanomyces invadans]XP_008879922.1 hypothetical protein, variant 2 [Aphanomyces invadans]XP_008879923.1 hypothetical protein, variant 9 [Aphanomyces invadans]XP_008879924.1 hypothetical protein, variant 3 [Aphanomyces invadans]XP_008879925.1 hypothetical protein, variant 4 [Aphanomyces invadans]XP_008879926.1 hypothetic|eukprot:XP_008879919.1 hypothetical protein H310_14004 [Aphanomyces invadans]
MKCCKPSISDKKVNQVLLCVFAILNSIAAVWLLVTDQYSISESGVARATISKIVLHLYHIMLSYALFAATAFGSQQPLEWFGLIGNFVGSGFYLFFLGFLTLMLDNTFGLVVAIVTTVYGFAVIVYGVVTKKPALPEGGTSYRHLRDVA